MGSVGSDCPYSPHSPHFPHGSSVGPRSQLTIFASTRAVECSGSRLFKTVYQALDERSVSFEGKYYRLRDARPGPRPAHPISIWVGAFKPRMIRLVGNESHLAACRIHAVDGRFQQEFAEITFVAALAGCAVGWIGEPHRTVLVDHEVVR